MRDKGAALFAGPGGSTPAPVYRRLATTDLDWSKVAVTLVDERYVPETSPESNARLIRDVLLQDKAASARFIPPLYARGDGGSGRHGRSPCAGRGGRAV